MVVTNACNSMTYSFPDSDSESDMEEYLPVNDEQLNSSTPIDLYEQRSNLIHLGCSGNLIEEYKRLTKLQLNKEYNNADIIKRNEHQKRLKEERERLLSRQRMEKEQEIQKLKTLISKLETIEIENEDEDKRFEEELKRQRELVDNAIAYDKKKYEAQSQQERARKEEEEKKKEEEAKKKEDEAKRKEENEVKEKEKKERISKLLAQKQASSVSLAGLEEYKQYYKKIEHYKKNIKPLLENPDFRKKCFDARRIVKRSLTQLQYKHEVILDKYRILHNHLMNIKQQSAEAFEVMLNVLSKAFLLQVKQEINATPFAAYFLARFAYLLCSTIPELQDYLMGRLMKRCPYLIPQYHDDDTSLSQDEIKARLRYVYTDKEKGVLESFLQHAEMQKCYVMFYGALCQTIPDPGQPPNPFPIKNAWIWLARICNMPPREITPVLVLGLLEVATIRLLEAYPHQTPKLLRLIRERICTDSPICKGNDNVASIERLKMFIDDYFNTGRPQCVPESLPSVL